MTTAGTQLRDQGQGAVLAADVAVHRGFAEYARDAVDQLIAAGMAFDAEDVRRLIPANAPEPHHANVLPAVLGALAKSGRIAHVGYRKATRASRRSGVLSVWQPATK